MTVALVEALWSLALATPPDLPAVALRSALFLIAAPGMWQMKVFGAFKAMGATAFLFLPDLLSGEKFGVGFLIVFLSVFDEARRAIESGRASGTRSARFAAVSLFRPRTPPPPRRPP